MSTGGIIKQNLEALQGDVAQLQQTAQAFLDSPEGFGGGFGAGQQMQKADGSAGKSTGSAAKQISSIDSVTHQSLQQWKNVVDNLAQFLAEDVHIMRLAEGAGSGSS